MPASTASASNAALAAYRECVWGVGNVRQDDASQVDFAPMAEQWLA